ncbi:DUF2971 domain-containing protein [Pseudogemmobacter faecipullorum]|uniref:DUF2971 domain-containing protein n=1 Tax=Pseudogemmobacter faecipullorum TaxID=2755041 RepID=A0ABS8CJ74_9RHOB|nr:DUF2971 domain-containing protein [Pseudogemmobacter faecipullorum]MCB5409443.1 DUF2971 domain-containing protein [Pseudogemmobacter faecipullorum]
MYEDRPVDQLFHYCSPSTFWSIIKYRQLWLTSLTQSNDTAEGKWILQRWLDAFDSNNECKRVQRNGAFHSVDMTLHEVVALGACFSEAGDQLSQWRGYAADGAGFAIGFDHSELEAVVTKHAQPSVSLSKIIYGWDDHERRSDLFKSLHGAFSPDFTRYSQSGGYGSMSIDNSAEARDAKLSAAGKLFSFKNPAFSEEKEWRLLIVGYLSQLEKVDYRESSGVISPFLKMDFSTDSIRTVRLGPTNRTPERVVEAFLEHSNITANVLKSSASYSSR